MQNRPLINFSLTEQYCSGNVSVLNFMLAFYLQSVNFTISSIINWYLLVFLYWKMPYSVEDPSKTSWKMWMTSKIYSHFTHQNFLVVHRYIAGRGVARGGHGCMSIFVTAPLVFSRVSILCPWTPLSTFVPQTPGLSHPLVNSWLRPDCW